MNETIFWDLIQKSLEESEGDLDAQYTILVTKLAALSEKEILEFDKIFNKHHVESYTSDLWGAAYIINGGCSDDGFDYFRGWLISRGREVFEAGMRDADSLASFIKIEEFEDGDAEFEDILGVARHAYKAKTSQDDFYDKVGEGEYRLPEITFDWDEDNVEEIFPKLAVLFSD